MKKILFICLLTLMLAGCKNENKCTLEQDESIYTLKQEVVLNINEDGFVTSTDTKLTMIFETEEDAQEYYNIFGDLEQQSALKLKKNKIVMTDIKEYPKNTKPIDVKKELKESGYTCK